MHGPVALLQDPVGMLTSCTILSAQKSYVSSHNFSHAFSSSPGFFTRIIASPPLRFENLFHAALLYMFLFVLALLLPCSSVSPSLLGTGMLILPVLLSQPDFFYAAYSYILKMGAVGSPSQ